MYLIKNDAGNTAVKQELDLCFTQNLKQAADIVNPENIKAGAYYLYKEKFGMVAVVKVVQKSSQGDWSGFRLVVKKVLHASWQVPKGTCLEVGYNTTNSLYPSSWHLEPGFSLLKSDPHTHKKSLYGANYLAEVKN